jgi:hypothetical protein
MRAEFFAPCYSLPYVNEHEKGLSPLQPGVTHHATVVATMGVSWQQSSYK